MFVKDGEEDTSDPKITTSIEEDTSEDTDTSEDESNDGDTSGSQDDKGGDKTPKNLFDPNEYPKELQPLVKKAQAILSRKLSGVSLLERKAQALDALTSDPRFIKWANELKNGNSSAKEEDEDTSEDDDTPLTRKQMQKMLKEELGSYRKNQEKEQEEERLNKEFTQFKKDNPGWETYRDDMNKLFKKNPLLSYDDCLYLAKRMDDNEEENSSNIQAKRRANIHKPNRGVSSKEPETKPDKKMTLDEKFEWAVKLAKKKLGMK